MNRTLLSLGLANNHVGDAGAEKLAQVGSSDSCKTRDIQPSDYERKTCRY